MIQPAQGFGVSDPEANRKLAEKIISNNQGSEYVKEFCTAEDFIQDPTAFLIKEMIDRGVGRARMDDGARAIVIGQIPDFIDKVGNVEYLKAFGLTYFKKHPNYEKAIAVFEKSLSCDVFKRDLNQAVTLFRKCQQATDQDKNYHSAEDDLRIPLTIFRQADELEEYTFPEDSSMECACVNE